LNESPFELVRQFVEAQQSFFAFAHLHTCRVLTILIRGASNMTQSSSS
jgi:hypothetical protein